MSTDTGNGKPRRKVTEPDTVEPEWPTNGGELDPAQEWPIGDEVASSRFGADAVMAVERINDAHERLADFRALWDGA